MYLFVHICYYHNTKAKYLDAIVLCCIFGFQTRPLLTDVVVLVSRSELEAQGEGCEELELL